MFACSLRPLPGARPVWQCLIHGNRSGSDVREERQLSTRERRVAGRPWAGVRPARLCEPQEQRLFAMRFVIGAPPPHRCLRALRSGSLYPNKRPAILRIALIAFGL